jgi:hypothetical protein
MKKIKLIPFAIVLTVLISFASFLYFTSKTQAVNPSPVTGTALIVNMPGYSISFAGANGGASGTIPYNVQYDPATGGMSGYAWSPQYGWINFTGQSGIALSLQNPNDTELPTDWANGLIKLNGIDGGSGGTISYVVAFNPDGTASSVKHWAWGGNVIGWVDFSNVTVIKGTLAILANGQQVISINSGTSVDLTWNGANIQAGSCTASGNWSGTGLQGIGSHSLGAVTNSGTYTITCLKSGGGTISNTASIFVNPGCTPTEYSTVGSSCFCSLSANATDPSCSTGCNLGDELDSTKPACYCPTHPTDTVCKKPPKFIEN